MESRGFFFPASQVEVHAAQYGFLVKQVSLGFEQQRECLQLVRPSFSHESPCCGAMLSSAQLFTHLVKELLGHTFGATSGQLSLQTPSQILFNPSSALM